MTRLSRALNTPGRLRLFAGGITVLAAIIGVLVLSTAFEHKQSVHQIGVDDVPSVVAAHNIKIEIESLDADLLNEMLVPPGEHGAWTDDFEKNRVDIGRHLIAAIHSAYGDDEDATLEKLEDGVGHYLMAAQEARDAHHRGEPAAAIAAYEKSFKILETELVAPATELNAISDKSLDESYAAQQQHSKRTRAAVFILGIALLALLIALQMYMRKRFRRMLSVPLVAAMVVTVAFTMYTMGRLRAHAHDLKGLKEDGYESVDALLASLADAYEANSAESRWLFDQSAAAEHQRRFLDYTTRVVDPTNQTFDQAIQTVTKRNQLIGSEIRGGTEAETAGQHARDQFPLGFMKGNLKAALDNIDTVDTDATRDEPTQATETLKTWSVYVGLDSQIRSLEAAGKHAEAVRFCLSMTPNESNWAFFQFDAALTRWLAIDQEMMNAHRDAAFADVAKLPWLGPVTALLVIALVLLAMRPRLKEYG
jgi:hypothetical protein